MRAHRRQQGKPVLFEPHVRLSRSVVGRVYACQVAERGIPISDAHDAVKGCPSLGWRDDPARYEGDGLDPAVPVRVLAPAMRIVRGGAGVVPNGGGWQQ